VDEMQLGVSKGSGTREEETLCREGFLSEHAGTCNKWTADKIGHGAVI